MSANSVRAALMQKWETANALLTGGPFSTAYPNRKFSKPASAPWAQVFHLANQPFVGSLGSQGDDEYSGVFQIDIYVPLSEGDGRLYSLFDEIRGEFKAGTYLTYSGQWVILLSCGMEPPRVEDAFYRGIINIEWETRLSRA